MPVIPGVNEQTVKAAAANTPYFTVKATAEDFGSEVGKSMQTLGESLGKASSAIETYAAEEQKRQKEADTSDAVDVTTRFQAKMQDIEQSFYGLSGQPAATGMPAIAMQVNRLKQDALSGAKTPEAAKLALGAINGVIDQSMWRIARHADSQQTVYDNDLDQQRVDQSKLIIARNYNDDEAFIINSHVADQSEQHIAIRGARSADGTITAAQAIAAADAARLSTMSEMIAARIGGALTQKDLPFAKKLYAKYGGELLPADRVSVDQQLHAVQFQSQLSSETERVSAGVQTPPSGMPTSGGSYRNADRVLHRSADDQEIGAGIPPAAMSPIAAAPSAPSAERLALSPIAAGPSGLSPEQKALLPIAAEPGPAKQSLSKEDRDAKALQYPEGGWEPKYTGEAMAMGPNASRAEAAIRNGTIKQAQSSPLPIDLRINPINKEVKQGDGHFGYVRDSGEKRHEGVDFAAPIGTPVLAVKDGTVIYKDASDKGYGNQVVIQHTDGTLTVYAHLRSIKDASGKYVSPVMEGQFVKAGQKIGEVGTTGNVGRAASHLHFETRYSSVVDDNYGQKKDNRTTIHPLYLFRGSGITIDGEKL